MTALEYKFTVEPANKIEIATLNSAIILLNLIREDINNNDYISLKRNLEIQICNADMMLRFANGKIQENNSN